MSAYMKPRLSTLKADGAVTAFTIVKAGSDEKHVAGSTAVTDKMKGIAMSKAINAEDPVEVAFPGGGAKLKLGSGGCSDGDYLTTDGSGQGIVSSTTGDHVVAKAQATGVIGDIIPVDVVDFIHP